MALIVLPIFFLLMWLLFILPQQKRVKAQEQYVASLAIGDEIVTAGGLYGTIVDLVDNTVRLEVADGVVITIARGAVARSQASVIEAEEQEEPEVAPVEHADVEPPGVADVNDSSESVEG